MGFRRQKSYPQTLQNCASKYKNFQSAWVAQSIKALVFSSGHNLTVSWVPGPHQALCWQCKDCLEFSLSLSLPLPHSCCFCLSQKQIKKLFFNALKTYIYLYLYIFLYFYTYLYLYILYIYILYIYIYKIYINLLVLLNTQSPLQGTTNHSFIQWTLFCISLEGGPVLGNCLG